MGSSETRSRNNVLPKSDMRHTPMTTEHQLESGSTLIIEWVESWQAYVGTITRKDGYQVGNIMRDTVEQIIDRATERRL